MREMNLIRKYTYDKIPKKFTVVDATEAQFYSDCGGQLESVIGEVNNIKAFLAKLTEQLYTKNALSKNAVLNLLPGFEELE